MSTDRLTLAEEIRFLLTPPSSIDESHNTIKKYREI